MHNQFMNDESDELGIKGMVRSIDDNMKGSAAHGVTRSIHVQDLESIPGENPYRHDSLRQGMDITSDGEYHIMFDINSHKQTGDMVFIKKSTGERVIVHLSELFKSVKS